jgi:hypothetical protein
MNPETWHRQSPQNIICKKHFFVVGSNFFLTLTHGVVHAHVVEQHRKIIFSLKFCVMNLTLEQLREMKHKLPTGSISKIASELNLEEQYVRNFFGSTIGGTHPDNWHHEQGPNGGIVHFEDTRIFDVAQRILSEHPSQ